VQVGVEPNRIDVLRNAGAVEFEDAWPRRIEGHYGKARANWVDIDSLIAIKSGIDHPRHQDDTMVLKRVRDRKGKTEQK